MIVTLKDPPISPGARIRKGPMRKHSWQPPTKTGADVLVGRDPNSADLPVFASIDLRTALSKNSIEKQC